MSSFMDNLPDPTLEHEDHAIIRLSADVERAIASMHASDDVADCAVDQAGFNVVDYINTIFPNEQSLTSIDRTLNKVQGDIRAIDVMLHKLLREQLTAKEQGIDVLAEAQSQITKLFTEINEIGCKAQTSERMVQDITRDVISLDYAKRNLTTSITTLNNLHMLFGAVDSLRSMAVGRQYREVANLLQAVQKILLQFDRFHGISIVSELASNVESTQSHLKVQIMEDLKNCFCSGSNGSGERVSHSVLTEAFYVVDVLGNDFRREIVAWFVSSHFHDYILSFGTPSQESSSLEKIDRRFAWLKRSLLQFDEGPAAIFPPLPHWNLKLDICIEFCKVSSTQLTKVLALRHGDGSLDVKLLLFSQKKLLTFEKQLDARFMRNDSSKVNNSATDVHSFQGLISHVFEPYLYLYVEAQDQQLTKMIEGYKKTFLDDIKNVIVNDDINLVGNGVTGTPVVARVSTTCADLFLWYKNCIAQGMALSTGQAFYDLYVVLKKHLHVYGISILQGNLPQISTASSASSTAAALLSGVSGTETTFTRQDVYTSCMILNTAEYCIETTRQLVIKFREIIDAPLVESVELLEEEDVFNETIALSISSLVRCIGSAYESAFTTMNKIYWGQLESVGDTSDYVAILCSVLTRAVPLIRDALTNPKFFTNFCLKIVQSIVPRYINAIYLCKPISHVGVEQLLLDAVAVKSILLDLPKLGTTSPTAPSSSYIKFVNKGMTRAEMMLKVVLSPHDPPEACVRNYQLWLGDTDLACFAKIMEMKGLKRNEVRRLIECFKEQSPELESTVTDACTMDTAGRGTVVETFAFNQKVHHHLEKFSRNFGRKF